MLTCEEKDKMISELERMIYAFEDSKKLEDEDVVAVLNYLKSLIIETFYM